MTDVLKRESVAEYLNRRTGKVTRIYKNIFGRLYQETDGRATSDFGAMACDGLAEDKDIVWQKTPNTHYHCWHVCTCDKCNPAPSTAIYPFAPSTMRGLTYTINIRKIA